MPGLLQPLPWEPFNLRDPHTPHPKQYIKAYPWSLDPNVPHAKSNIDRLEARATSRDLCGRGCIVGFNPTEKKALIIPLTCKSWSCPTCAPAKKARWSAIALSGRPQRMITLTVRRDATFNLYDTLDSITHSWAKLVQRIRRKFGEFEYLKVWELTKQGAPHLHVLQRGCYIPQKWLSDAWDALTGSPVVDIRAIKEPRHASRYVYKYLSKTLTTTAAYLSGRRLISKSDNYCPHNEDNPPAIPEITYAWKRTRADYHILLDYFYKVNALRIAINETNHTMEIDTSQASFFFKTIDDDLLGLALWLQRGHDDPNAFIQYAQDQAAEPWARWEDGTPRVEPFAI